MKRFGILVATAALGAVLVTSGPTLAFDGAEQQYRHEPGLAEEPAARQLELAASILITPLAGAVLAVPPTIGNHCATDRVICLLSQPSRIGNDCFCRAYSGYARGLVQ